MLTTEIHSVSWQLYLKNAKKEYVKLEQNLEKSEIGTLLEELDEIEKVKDSVQLNEIDNSSSTIGWGGFLTIICC